MKTIVKNKQRKDSETSVNAVLEILEASNSDLYNQAKNMGIDVRAIASEVVERNSNKSVSVCVSFVKSRLNKLISEAEAEEVRGIIVGGRDIYGKNFPVRYPLIKSDKNHIELSSYDTRVPYGNDKVDIPLMSISTFGVQKSTKYNSYKIVNLRSFEKKTPEEISKLLDKVAIIPSEITAEHKYRVVVVKGIIDRAQPVGRWENREEVGKNPVMMENALGESVKHPVIQLQLLRSTTKEGVGDTITRLVFDRMRFSSPTIAMDDMYELCEEASTNFSTPSEQANFVGDGLKDRAVIAVGVVTNFNAVTTEKYGTTYFVDIGCCFICDAPEGKFVSQKQMTIRDYSENNKETKSETVVKGNNRINDVAEAICDYCKALGIRPDSLSVDDVYTKVCSSPSEPYHIFTAALELARKRWV